MYVCTLVMRKRESDDASRVTIALELMCKGTSDGARLWVNR